MSRQPSPAELRNAAERFQAFHWDDPPDGSEVVRVPLIVPGAVLWQLGELVEVHYRTHKRGKRATWWHAFQTPLPVLACTSEGRPRLVVVGGGYKVTAAGIVG
jgi:hypothetical protein